MRGLLQFLVFLAIVFFVVGEFFGGWYLGVPPQTPMFLYKKDHTVTRSRRTTTAESFTFSLNGKVRRGTVTVEGYFQKPSSFQSGTEAGPRRKVFEEVYLVGQTINLIETMEEGQGVYEVRMIYDDATGLFTLELPEAGTL